MESVESEARELFAGEAPNEVFNRLLTSPINGDITHHAKLAAAFYQCFTQVDQRLNALNQLLDVIHVQSDEEFFQKMLIVIALLEVRDDENDEQIVQCLNRFITFLPRVVTAAENCLDIDVSNVTLRFTVNVLTSQSAKQLLERDLFFKLCQHVDEMLQGLR